MFAHVFTGLLLATAVSLGGTPGPGEATSDPGANTGEASAGSASTATVSPADADTRSELLAGHDLARRGARLAAVGGGMFAGGLGLGTLALAMALPRMECRVDCAAPGLAALSLTAVGITAGGLVAFEVGVPMMAFGARREARALYALDGVPRSANLATGLWAASAVAMGAAMPLTVMADYGVTPPGLGAASLISGLLLQVSSATVSGVQMARMEEAYEERVAARAGLSVGLAPIVDPRAPGVALVGTF